MLFRSLGSRKGSKAYQALKVLRLLKKRSRGLEAVNFIRWANRAARDPELAERFPKLIEAVTQYSDEAVDLLLASDRGLKHLDNLEQTLRVADDLPGVVKALKGLVNPADLAKSEALLRDVFAVAAKTEKVTAKAVGGIVKVVNTNPAAARMAILRVNFQGRTHEIWELVDDAADLASANLSKVITDLGTLLKPFTYAAKGAEGVLRYARAVGKKVTIFERKVKVPGGRVRRYDASYKLDLPGVEKYLDVDVKDWVGFSKSGRLWREGSKEADKIQRDILFKFTENGYETLKWAVPSKLRGRAKDIGEWMLEQFDSQAVQNGIDPRLLKDAKGAFKRALDNGTLLDFF